TKIYERLTSPWSGQFTKEEANYAIQKLGDK
ncbi:Ltp family lipoprotein, partial [Streptococcus mitis]